LFGCFIFVFQSSAPRRYRFSAKPYVIGIFVTQLETYCNSLRQAQLGIFFSANAACLADFMSRFEQKPHGNLSFYFFSKRMILSDFPNISVTFCRQAEVAQY
jgi:hypothetical protein